MNGLGPPPPPRTVSAKTGNNDSGGWRESIGVLLAILLSIAVLFSFICLLKYALRERAVYEEVVDYLDKTISISKINYHPTLPPYQVNESELQVLASHRKYKTMMWAFLLSDVGCYVFLLAALLLYYGTDVSQGTPHVFFWIVLILGVLYSIVEASIFTVLLFPHTSYLPNGTESLLDHAIPYNPGGLMQMEQRFGCIFDHNLYNTFKRRENPRNSCDPYIETSFIPRAILIIIILLRLFAVFIFAIFAAKREPFGILMANLIAKTKPSDGYKNRFIKNPNAKKNNYKVDIHTPKSTTFGVKDNRYNNAAFFATSGLAGGLNSSRSSEISKQDIADMCKTSIRTSNSLVSEV
uniref:Uncharacterized protein n=1 Tax=Acrobeloides nanus TaxID=290746 RepID=A0A914E504_9BILA